MQCQGSALSEAPKSTGADAQGVFDSIILQGFGWESCRQGGWWRKVADKAPEIAAGGFTHIWLPPPSQSVSTEGYLPSQLYNFNSAYGSESDLRACLQRLKEAGVKPVADCVFNHRCGDKQNEKGNWVVYSNAHEPEGVATCAWDASAITSDDPAFDGTGSSDTGEDFHAAPDLDHTSAQVQAGLSDFTKYLVENLGFEGLRFDFSKGYGGEYAGQYTRAAIGEHGFAVGEFWTPLKYDSEGDMVQDQVKHRREVERWIDETGGRCMAFDFGTKGLLQEAIRFKKYDWLVDKEGRPHGLIGTRPAHAVTFIDNHDTGSTQAHWPFPRMKKLEGYAYVLTHPGVPTVFWEHMFEDADELAEGIKALVQLRQRAGIAADSAIEVLAALPEQYIARVQGRSAQVLVKLGPKRDMKAHKPEAEDGWVQALKGKDFCIWERSN